MTTTQKNITTAALCAMTAVGFAGDVLYSCPCKISNQTQSWLFLKSEAGKMVYVPFEGYYESKGGRMLSPIIKLDKESGETDYYNPKFKAKTSEQCYWWVDFFDADGNPLPDTNSAVYPAVGRTSIPVSSGQGSTTQKH